MRRGFTLVELIIVIMIVGILATLGLAQYLTVIERSRGTEARQVISTLRSVCSGLWMQDDKTDACTAGMLGLSTLGARVAGEMPGSTCWPTNFFRYTIVSASGNNVVFKAIRCVVAETGKVPGVGGTAGSKYLQLDVNYAAGTDVWSSVGGY